MTVDTNVGSGDNGTTSLLSGERVPKTHARIEACGDVDELISFLGALAAAFPTGQEGLGREIQSIQGDLLRVGARLATSPDSPTLRMLPTIGPERIASLEDAIDRMEAALPRLQSFILPGGHPTAAWAHVARAVCRRAERHAAALDAEGVLPYLNRMSTYLFVLARWCNRLHGFSDMQWKG